MWTIAAEQLTEAHAEATAERTVLLLCLHWLTVDFCLSASGALGMKLVIDAA